MAAKPICNTGTNTCRACQADSQCPADPGVCLANIDGHCATPGETIYVENSSACSDAVAASDATAATSAKPLCSMQPVSMFVSNSRALVRVRGTVAGATSAFTLGAVPQATFVGQQAALVASSVTPAFSIQSGTAFIRTLDLSSSASVGISATGGTLHLDTVTVDSCKKGGILVDGAAFDIENTTVTNNSQGTQGATTWGGILVLNPTSSGPSKLQLVTVQNNTGGGIACSEGLSMVSGVLASGNTLGPDVNSTCGFSSCGTASPTCGAH